MLKIGITGGIGSGKTTISRIFSTLGAPVYNADARARWLMEHDANLIRNIKASFGESSYLEEGKLNSRYISSIVFNNKERLRELNSFVHPAVGRDFKRWAEANSFPYVLKEAALLFESGSYKLLDKVIVVACPEELRIKRTLARDPHRTKEEVTAIIQRQLPEGEKIARADFVIHNDEKSLVIPQVLRLHSMFCNS